MSATRYTVRMTSGEKWTMLADMAEASAQIQHEADGEVYSTPFQTADARHDAMRAAEICADYWARQSGDTDTVESVEAQS